MRKRYTFGATMPQHLERSKARLEAAVGLMKRSANYLRADDCRRSFTTLLLGFQTSGEALAEGAHGDEAARAAWVRENSDTVRKFGQMAEVVMKRCLRAVKEKG